MAKTLLKKIQHKDAKKCAATFQTYFYFNLCFYTIFKNIL
jgi:hypothetical protein